MLYDRNGNQVTFSLTVPAGLAFAEAAGNMIAQDLKKLGMTVYVQQLDFNVLNDKLSNSLDWESCITHLTAIDALEPNDGANAYKSSGRLHEFDQRLPDDSGNIVVTDARPWERQLDELFSTGALTLDKSKRHQIYDQYQKIIYDEAPFVYLASPLIVVGVRNTVQNYQPTQLSQFWNGVHNLEEIWKKQ